MRQDCCQKPDFPAATLVHAHCFICTTNVQVGVTQIGHRAGISVTESHGAPHPWRALTIGPMGFARRHIAGFSPHLCPLVELPKPPIINSHWQRLFL
jgi:hypothetical protein